MMVNEYLMSINTYYTVVNEYLMSVSVVNEYLYNTNILIIFYRVLLDNQECKDHEDTMVRRVPLDQG